MSLFYLFAERFTVGLQLLLNSITLPSHLLPMSSTLHMGVTVPVAHVFFWVPHGACPLVNPSLLLKLGFSPGVTSHAPRHFVVGCGALICFAPNQFPSPFGTLTPIDFRNLDPSDSASRPQIGHVMSIFPLAF